MLSRDDCRVSKKCVLVYVGILMAIAQIGMLLGPVLGGVLTQHATWRWCELSSPFLLILLKPSADANLTGFYLNLPCGGLIAILLIFIHIPDRTVKFPGKQGFLPVLKKVDLTGFVLFALAIIQLILALEWGGVFYAWNSATIIGLFCGSFCTIVVFLAWEYRIGDEAMIPFSIIGRRVILCSCLNMAFVLGCLEVTAYYLPIYFQAVHNASPTMSGVNLLATLLSSLIFLVITGGLGMSDSDNYA
jgi:MFS family permease